MGLIRKIPQKISCLKLCLVPILAGVMPLQASILEEVTVTAQKREQSLQDVGISVTAFTGRQLRALGYTDTTDIAAQTPAFTYSQWSPSLTFLNIRGVSQSDFSDHHEPPNAVYVDEAYVSSMGAVSVQMYDLQRVEVLRGPQGTLFGRNATGGLVHYISNKPTQNFEGYGEITYASYEQVRFEGAVSGALSDSVLGRLSVATNRYDGWMKNRIGTDLNDAESYSARAQLLADLSATSELWVKFHYSLDDSHGAGYTFSPNGLGPNGLGVTIGPNELGTFVDFGGNTFQTCPGCSAHWYSEPDNDPRTGSFSQTGGFDREIWGVSVKYTADFQDLTFTSVTDYLDMNKDYLEDTDGSPVTAVDFYSEQELGQFSQEMRLNGSGDKLNWTAGLYYLDIDNETGSGLSPVNIAPFIGLNFPEASVPLNTGYDAVTDTESWAVFGHLEYSLTNEVTVIGALRYSDDKKRSDYLLTDDTGLIQNFSSETSPLATQHFENISAKLEVKWQPSDDWMFYANYNRGHKAGSFNYPFIGPVNFSDLPHDEEVLTSYEVGAKGTFLDDRARLNVSAFYYDYKDRQASFFVNLANIIGNVDSEAYGSEVELQLNATNRLEFIFGLSLLETKTKDVGMPDGTVQDREMPYAPNISVNGVGRYTWPLVDGRLITQLDFNYLDNYCFTTVCHFSERADDYIISNMRITYSTAGEQWSFSGFIKNLTDTDYRVYATDSNFVGFHTNMFNPPRWYGVSASYRW